MFREASGGFWSLMLDDDGCYCHTSIEYGRQTCGPNNYNRFGVEVMDRTCTESAGLQKSIYMFYRNISVSTSSFGRGWQKFFHFSGGSSPVRDMLGMEYGSCRRSARTRFGVRYTPAVCPQRMPNNLAAVENNVELLAIDSRGTALKWRFRANCNTANRAFRSFTQGTRGRWAHGCAWNPIQVIGGRSPQTQDSWTYRDQCGTVGFSLDDDNCYCHTTLELGRRFCGTGCSGNYGMDWLRDTGCNFVQNSMTNRYLALYFRVV